MSQEDTPRRIDELKVSRIIFLFYFIVLLEYVVVTFSS